MKLLRLGVASTLVAGLFACSQPPAPSPNNSNTVSAPESTPRAKPRTPLESTLNDTASGNFVKVMVFTRLDGAKMVQEDFDFLKANAPTQTNQWLKTDDGLHVVAGTNFPFKPEQLEALGKRFKIEDKSSEYGRKK